jgi:anti-sigma B factor antagonist
MKLADVHLSPQQDTVVATISGEIDMSNAGELEVTLSTSTSNEALGLVLDLSGVDYLDSAGIQLLFKLHSALRTRGQALVLVVPEESLVAGTFRLAGLSGPIPMVTRTDEALARIAGNVR